MPLSAGDKLGPYEMLAPIGAGGMGEVWKARDTRLGRIVAIKQMKGEHSARFEQEARAIAALNHPNICQIHDIGPDYLVMEYVEGKPLSGPLRVEEALKLAVQIASAMEEAHGKGILHRDLKPANILVTAKGSAKILDFGLAKLMTETDTSATQTMEGSILGTAAYMAPEQAEGKPLDGRSDVFSFGTVLYEMLSGNRAFPGNSTATVLSAVLRDDPAPLHAPTELQRIIGKCLAKQPGNRFSSMEELRVALERISAKAVDRQPSIAVLPFANLSASKDDEYFSEGLAEEILNLLVRIKGLKVTARTSSFAFRGKEQDITGIAAALKVSTILEGSVRRAGNRIRVTAQLINAADGYHIWSERYDREMTDVFAVQDEMAAAISQALHVELAAKTESTSRYQPKLPAYEAFLKGRRLLFQGSPVDLARAKEYLDQAVTLDPYYADAFAELGMYYYLQCQQGVHPGTEVLPLARAAANKALDLAPSGPRAHGVLGLVAAFLDYDWKTADEHVQRAKATGFLAPEVQMRCGLILVPRGRFMEAIREVESALAQDPIAVLPRTVLALDLFFAEQYERAEAEAKIAMELDQVIWATRYVIALSYVARGKLAEAREWAEQAVRVAPWSAHCAALLAGVLERLGERQRASELVGEWRSRPTHMFTYHLLCSNLDAAADCYEAAIAQRDPFPLLFAAAPFTKPLRESPRWRRLAKMMNLPEAP